MGDRLVLLLANTAGASAMVLALVLVALGINHLTRTRRAGRHRAAGWAASEPRQRARSGAHARPGVAGGRRPPGA